MYKKRGQITIFIILGILILLIIFLFIYFRQATTVFKPERVVPPELKPFDEFVGSCIDRVARNGINILGANGGFIRFPPEIDFDYQSTLKTNPLFPSIKTPLWHYKGQTRIPSEEYMKEDLAYYINQNLDECLGNLEAFKQQFEIIELEPRKVLVDLTDNSVDVTLDYRLEIRSLVENQTTRITEFKTSVPIRLKTVYELARNVMEEELKDKFIELRTIDLLALDKSTPYTDLEFTCSPKIWYVSDINAKLKRLLEANLPLIRVEKTSYEPIPADQPYVANHYIWEVTDVKYPSTHVSFSYDRTWTLQLHISPNEGYFLKSNAQRGFDLMSFFCMHLYHFTYDIKYPVLVTITDDQGKNHEKYTFNFGIETGVNHNRPDKTNFGISFFDFTQKDTADRFCIEAESNLLTVHTFENISTQEYGDLYAEIAGVNLTYTCIRFKCPMGQSEWQFRGAVALLTQEVPFCINGVLRGTKPGYDEAYTFVSTDAEKTVDLYLTPSILKNVTVVKHYVIGDRVDSEQPIEETQTAIITIKKKDFRSTAFYPPSQGIPSELKFNGKWDYTYELEIYLVDDRTILGGYIGNWTIPWNKLVGTRMLKFHVVEFPYTEEPEKQFMYMTALPETSKKVPGPEFLA